MSTATRLGLTGPLVDPLTGDGPADHGPDAVGQTLVDSLRLTFRARAVVSTDVPRLRTALIWFEAFLTATGRTPFRPAFGAANTIGQMWNAESLELFAEFVRRSTPRGRTRGTSVSSNSISGYVSAIRLLRSREARYPVAPPEIDLNLPLALKAMRIEDGPSGARARSLGVRAETLSNAASAGADRGSAQGAVDWAAAVIAHNAILRGGEVGVQCGRDPDPSRVISWKSFGWQAPRAESLWRPWLILSVVPIKDPRGSKSAYPIPVPRRHDGPMGSDPLCPYDAAAIAWWLRCAPRGQPFPVDARGWPLPDWHLTAPPPRPGAPFFTDASGTVMDTTYVRNLARRLARLGGMPEADVADVGGKAFRIGGATDLRYECGEQGAPLVKQRGRWDSDVAAVYMRPLLGMQLSAAAAVGSVRGAGLEELCAGFAQRAVPRPRLLIPAFSGRNVSLVSRSTARPDDRSSYWNCTPRLSVYLLGSGLSPVWLAAARSSRQSLVPYPARWLRPQHCIAHCCTAAQQHPPPVGSVARVPAVSSHRVFRHSVCFVTPCFVTPVSSYGLAQMSA